MRRVKERKTKSEPIPPRHRAAADTKAQDMELLRDCREFGFVVTDIESSTELSSMNPGAFAQVGSC